MNKRPIILIDQDDVLAEYIKGVTVAFNKKFQTNFTTKDCNSWNLISVFGDRIEEVMHEPELFRNLEPVQDAIEVFKRLYTSGLFEMYIVTAANPRAVEAKFEWIEEKLPFFPRERIIVCASKYMIKGDFLLDDGMHNIIAFEKAGGSSIVFKRPHNETQIEDRLNVSSWLAFEKMIMEKCYPEMINSDEIMEDVI